MGIVEGQMGYEEITRARRDLSDVPFRSKELR